MRSRRLLPIATAGAALCTVAALAIPATPAVAATSAASAGTHTYLIYMKTPTRSVSTGARREAVIRSQRAVRERLASLGARVVARTLVPDALTVKLTARELRSVDRVHDVLAVLPSGTVPVPTSNSITVHQRSASASSSRAHAVHGSASSLCGTASNPQLNPEALTNIDAEPAILSGADGAGVNVAYIADGVDTTDPDFQRNAAVRVARVAHG